MAKLEFFWDVGSSYTYLAATQLSALVERTGAELSMRPFLLGGVFKATGNKMPASVIAKAKYMGADLMRWRDHYGVPMKMPVAEVVFPINSLLPMRAATACELNAPEKLHSLSMAIMNAYWSKGLDVSGPEVLSGVIEEVGLDPASLLEAASSQAVKDRLRATTDQAVERGAFGAPAMFVGDQLFWGNDRLHFVEAALKAST